ncbi:MAG: CPBP family intramembrane glutamic endopeptidase [Hyphococcus sp.]
MTWPLLLWGFPVSLFIVGAVFGDLFDLLAMASALIIATAFRPARKATFCFIHRSVAYSVLIGLLSGLALTVVLTILEIGLLKSLGWSPDLSNFEGVRGSPEKALLLAGIAVIYGGILEEIAFRGFAIGYGASILGRQAALPLALFMSVIFGAAHSYQGIGGMMLTGAAGLGFGLVYLMNNCRLLPAMTAHAVFNILGVALIYYGIEAADIAEMMMR